MSNELAVLQEQLGAIQLSEDGRMMMKTVKDAFIVARLMQVSTTLPAKVTPEMAVIAILAGARLRLDPFYAVQKFAVVNGRPTMWGDALTAVVKGSGLVEDEKVEYLPDHKNCIGVRYTVKRKGIATPYVGEFSKTMAEKAGLWGKTGPWTQYPDRMMLNRARAFALRDGFSDVLNGIGFREEEEDVERSSAAGIPVDAVDAQEAPKPRKKRAPAAAVIEASAVEVAPHEAEIPQGVADEAEPIEVTAAPEEAKAPAKAGAEGDGYLNLY